MNEKPLIESIDPETLIDGISERVTANILKAVRNEHPEHSEQLLTIDEVSTLLHLSKATIYTKVSRNEIPGVCKQGKRLYFDRRIIIEWIKQGRKTSNVENSQDLKTYLLNKSKQVEQDLKTCLLNKSKQNEPDIKTYLLNKRKEEGLNDGE